MDAQRFDVGDAVRFGWEKTRANLNLVIVLTIAAFAVTAIPSGIAQGLQKNSPFLSAVFSLLGAVASMVVSVGATRISLRLHDGGTAEVRELFPLEWPLIWRYFLATVLYSLVVAVGLVLLIVPGIIFAVRYAFYGYAVVDRNAGPVESLAQSAAATRGAWWTISLFGLAILLLNVLGAMLLGVGLLVTVPVSVIAAAWVYRRLTGVPAPAAPAPTAAQPGV